MGKDAIRTVLASIINEIIGVPSRPRGAHLDEPWPDIARRTVDSDGVIDGSYRMGDQVIASEGLSALSWGSVDLHRCVECKNRESNHKPTD